jgi:hypothetical protein
VGLVAGRATRPAPAEATAAPIHDAPARVIAAPPSPAVVAEAPHELDGDDGDGMDVGQAIANAKAEAAAHLAEHNTIRGTIDDRPNVPAIGATVVMTAPNNTTQVAITDEHGQYLITQLPAGSYTMTIYYNDRTLERRGVVASEFSATTQDDVLEPELQLQLEGAQDMNNTFEGVLGAAADPQNDEGVTFSGGDYIENTYVVDLETD